MNASKRRSTLTKPVTEFGVHCIKFLFSYVVARHKSMSPKEIVDRILRKRSPQVQEVVEMLMPELELVRMREVLIDQLAARFRRVPARIQARIRAADEAALKRWSARLSTAASCAEVLDDDAEAPGGARAGGAKKTRGARRRPASASKRA